MPCVAMSYARYYRNFKFSSDQRKMLAKIAGIVSGSVGAVCFIIGAYILFFETLAFLERCLHNLF